MAVTVKPRSQLIDFGAAAAAAAVGLAVAAAQATIKIPDHRFRIDGGGGGGSSYAEPGACGVHMVRGPEDNDDGFVIIAKALCDPH